MNIVDIALWVFGIWMVAQVIKSIATVAALKEAHEKVINHLDKIIREVTVEKHGEVEYWFDKETDQFLGQGKTTEELVAHIKSRFPDHIFIVNPKGVLCAPRWEFVEKVDADERAKYYATK
jgi:hypothetical protein